MLILNLFKVLRSKTKFSLLETDIKAFLTFKFIKNSFDPLNIFNPGKIVDAPKLDERDYFRYAPSYTAKNIDTILDWSSWTGSSGGFQGAIEMCNNNGSCRKLEGGVMCPSFRVTKDEKDSTRGRANSLRLALSGQLGKGFIQ